MILEVKMDSNTQQRQVKPDDIRRRLEERRRHYRIAQLTRKKNRESTLMQSISNMADGMVSLVTEPTPKINLLKARRNAYRYNKVTTQKLMILRDAYRTKLLIARDNNQNVKSVVGKSNGPSYRFGRQNFLAYERPNPALVRFMMGRGGR